MSDLLSIRPLKATANALGAFDDMDWNEAQIQARAAWYYYIGGLTQQEIADKLGITRLRVNRFVGQARTDGLVHVEIHMPLASCVALEERLKDRFGLVDVSIVPSISDYDAQLRVIGEAAGVLLQAKLRDGISLGIGWGRTLRAAVRRLKANRFANCRAISLMGGMMQGSGNNTYEVCSEFARVLGAECSYIAAPIYCPSEESRDMLLTHFDLADIMRRARECDIALLSCGNLSATTAIATQHVIQEHMDGLVASGAVGNVLGTFIDADGCVIDHPLNKRVMALAPHELKSIPTSILVAGGAEKLGVIRAIISGGYVNSLVTDESIAERLLT